MKIHDSYRKKLKTKRPLNHGPANLISYGDLFLTYFHSNLICSENSIFSLQKFFSLT